MTTLRKDIFWPSFRDWRQLSGERVDLLLRNELSYNLYKSMSTRKEYIWDSSCRRGYVCPSLPGGIFNVQYSPDGSLLLATTQNKKVLIFSSNSHQLIDCIENSHKSCVNFIRFVDLRTFVTCSDDCTLGVWDLRNTNKKIKSLKGHKNWVKSIEYDSSKGVLLSASYDQTVRKWDINDPSNGSEEILHIKNMLRMTLTPDSTKMIISTADGYLLIIHDLDLNTLAEDLNNFVPDLYRLMQDDCNFGFDMGSWNNHLFHSSRNRVELISDFPRIDKNGYITTLDVHPFGWSVLSRNTAGNELSEWTCVHDIQHSDQTMDLKPIKFIGNYYKNENSMKSIIESESSSGDWSEMSANPIIVVSNQIGSSQPHTTVVRQSTPQLKNTESERSIYRNIPRLKYYIEELNENHGYIKELCFSSDGRIVCSPFQFGFRLLSFDSKCSEMSECVSNEPKVLYELKKSLCHPDYCVTTKFSPTHCQIASGCLKGRVIFSEPIL